MTSNARKSLGEERFRELLLAYGADFERWPVDERDAAKAFVATNAEAGAWLVEHERLDAMLAGAPELEPSADLLRRVAEIPLREAGVAPKRAFWPFARLRNAFAVLASVAAMGAAVGAALPDRITGGTDELDAGWDDFASLSSALDIPEDLAP